MQSTKNACMYYPKHQGLIAAIAGAGGNLGAAGFNYLSDVIINPDKLEADEGKYYSMKISARYKIFLYYHMGITMGCTFIAMGCLFRYKKNENEKMVKFISEKPTAIVYDEPNNQGNNIDDHFLVSSGENEKEQNENYQEIAQEDNDISEEKELQTRDKSLYYKDLKNVLKSIRVWRIFFIFFCSSFSQNIITTTFMTFGTIEHINTTVLDYSAILNSFIGTLVGPLWGVMIDKIGFKFALSIMNILGAICSVVFYFSRTIYILYGILVVMNGALSCGIYANMFPHILKVYSFYYATEIYGLILFSTGLSNILSTTYAFIITEILKESTNNLAYLYIYVVGGALNLISVLLTYFENDEQFEYDLVNSQ